MLRGWWGRRVGGRAAAHALLMVCVLPDQGARPPPTACSAALLCLRRAASCESLSHAHRASRPLATSSGWALHTRVRAPGTSASRRHCRVLAALGKAVQPLPNVPSHACTRRLARGGLHDLNIVLGALGARSAAAPQVLLVGPLRHQSRILPSIPASLPRYYPQPSRCSVACTALPPSPSLCPFRNARQQRHCRHSHGRTRPGRQTHCAGEAAAATSALGLQSVEGSPARGMPLDSYRWHRGMLPARLRRHRRLPAAARRSPLLPPPGACPPARPPRQAESLPQSRVRAPSPCPTCCSSSAICRAWQARPPSRRRRGPPPRLRLQPSRRAPLRAGRLCRPQQP